MSAYKDKKTGNWVVTLRYTDDQGNVKRRAKRGFKTKRDAVAWETNFLLNNTNDLNTTFDEFFEVYMNDISNRIRDGTKANKRFIFEKYIQPYFGKKDISEIQVADLVKWQNKILGLGFKDTYCRSINNQLVSILNHAERYYNYQNSPTKKIQAMGSKHASTINFWTKEEFDTFISHVDDESANLHFKLLFYTGLRVGELIGVFLEDIDFERGHIHIKRSAQYKAQEYIFSKPKTKKSERIVTIPNFLLQEIKTFVNRYYTIDLKEQVFMTDKSRLAYELKKYAKVAGVKRIRVHDLRHSHASLLIEQGIQPNMVQDRLGHEKIETTLNTYSHLYPNKQYHLADFLDHLATNNNSKHQITSETVIKHESLMIQTTK